MTHIDPRTRGFNYGIGWGKEPKPDIYETAVRVAQLLRKQAAETSRRSWELDHALWVLRTKAETPCEKEKAVADLQLVLAQYTGRFAVIL